QFLKAGLMEVFDVLVVNKSDLGPLAEAARRELVSALRVMGRRDATVVMTSALNALGIAPFAQSLENRDIDPSLQTRALVEHVLSELVAWRGLERIDADGGVGALRARLSSIRNVTPRTLLNG